MAQVTRRGFFALGASSAAAAALAGCQSARPWTTLEPYVQPPEQQVAGNATWYASTCRMCCAGCGIIVRVMNGRAIKIEGNPLHPANQGKLCARGQASLQMLYHPDRLQNAVQQKSRGSRQFAPVSWDEAVTTLSAALGRAGAGLAIWCGSTVSGHVYDIAQRLAKAVSAQPPLVYDADIAYSGFGALRAANQALFGSNTLPVYDISRSDVLFSFAADLFGPWLAEVRHGIAYGAFRSQARAGRGYMVQFEPRMSLTAARADRWLPVTPGSEGLIAQAIARLIADRNLGAAERVARARAFAGVIDLNAAAAAAGISLDDLAELARLFASAERPLAVPGAQLAGLDKGADAVRMVQALNVIAGNAAGNGAGGVVLAQPLPAGAAVELPTTPYAAVQQLVARMAGGQVQALLVIGANPAFELPPQLGFAEAAARVPFVATFSPLIDETSVLADLVLADRTPLESWGYAAAMPGYQTAAIGSMQPVVTPLYDLRPAADVVLSAARTIPAVASALPFGDELAMLKDTAARLPAAPGDSAGADVRWARFLQQGGWWPPTAAPAQPAPAAAAQSITISPVVFQGDAQEFPYYLNLYPTVLVGSGRGAALPLLQGCPEPMTSIAWQTWVQISSETASKLGVDNGDVVSVTSPHGEIMAPVYVYPGLRPDTVAIPFGQGHTDYGRFARAFGANPLRLVGVLAEASGSSVQWSNVRVKLARTGKVDRLATFEYTPGVRQGFDNKGVPGE